MSQSIPFISNQDVISKITMSQAISAMEQAFRLISENKAVIPLRINMHMPEVNADSLVMPVYSSELNQYAVKTVSLNFDNHLRKLPLIHSVLTLFDALSGKPLARMDAEILTALRTGAGGGLSAKRLAIPDAKCLVAFGAGIQSEYQIRSILAVRPINKVYIITRSSDKVNDLVAKLKKEYYCEFIATESKEMLNEADIISTATTATSPLFDKEPLKPHVHIIAVGSYKPSLVELGPSIIKHSIVFVDEKLACLKEAGDLINAVNNGLHINNKTIYELGEEISDYSQFQSTQTVFKSVGNAIQDLVIASHIFSKQKP